MLTDEEILSIIDHELQHSAGGDVDDEITSNRKDAISYYLGLPNGKETKGRSTVISTDVADAIEWILPEIIKALTKNNDIVSFDAEFEGDQEQVELETQFVHDIVLKDNDGFVLYYTLVKDALLNRNCVYKIFYDKNENVTTEDYTGITENELAYMLNQQGFELVSRTSYPDELANIAQQEQYEMMMQQYQQQLQQMQQQAPQQQAPQQQQMPQQTMPPPPQPPQPVMLNDIRVKKTIRDDKITIIPIPLHEFRISSYHTSIDPKKARFTAHVALKTASDLIEEGVPKEIVDDLPRDLAFSEYAHISRQELTSQYNLQSLDSSQELIQVAECVLRIDVDEDGISELMKIRVADVSKPSVILDMVQLDADDHPFGAGSVILMPHQFWGLSIYDRLKQIQDQKTALWRNIFDNLYLHNNQRVAVVEGRVNLDDLLISRPGGIIRQDSPGMIEPLAVNSTSAEAYAMLEYLDKVRSGRVGVDPEQNINEQVSGLNAGDASVNALMTAKEELVGLMTRVMAETVVKPMLIQARNLARKHLVSDYDYNFRNEWRKVNPSQWRERKRTTIHVGTGSGHTKEQQAALLGLIQLQEKIMAFPSQTLVNEDKIFNAINSLAKLSGIQNVHHFFIDPKSSEGQESKQAQQQQMQEEQMKEEEMKLAVIQSQMGLAKAEQGKADAQMQNAILKAEIDRLKAQLEDAKNQAESKAKDLAHTIEIAKINLERDRLDIEEALKLTELEITAKKELSAQHEQNKAKA